MQLWQLVALRQTGSVTEYLEKFEQLSHRILLYNASYDDTYFVVRFLGGLKEEIRAGISLHQPKDVQTASTLAILQEEELAHSNRKGTFRDSGKFSFRSMARPEKSKNPQPDRYEKSSNPTAKVEKPAADDMLKALIAYHKKHGLCYKCSEKWGHNHSCPPHVPLHVIEELFDAMETPEDDDNETESEPDTILAVSNQSPATKRKTMKLNLSMSDHTDMPQLRKVKLRNNWLKC